jgi:hypothetical protein
MKLNPRTQRRLDRIKDKVDILALLEEFGFQVRADMDREQQFQCRLHGSGQDNKPSARVYPETSSWNCWACQKSRDAVSTAREVLNLGFMDAIKWLEAKHKLPPMSYEAGDNAGYQKEKDRREVVEEALVDPLDQDHRTFEDDARVLRAILDMVTEEKQLSLARVTAYWDAFDRVVFFVQGKGQDLPEAKGRVALGTIKSRVMEEIKGG